MWSEWKCFATPRFCRIVAVLGFLECRSDKNLTIKFLEGGLLKALFDKTYKLMITWSQAPKILNRQNVCKIDVEKNNQPQSQELSSSHSHDSLDDEEDEESQRLWLL